MNKLYFNRIFLSSGLLWAALANTSCKKLIQIPSSPPNEIAESAMFTDSATAMTAVAGVYTYSLQSQNDFAYSDGDFTFGTGLSSDELVTTEVTDQNLAQFTDFGLTAVNSDVGSLWKAPFTSLYAVNDVIANVNTSPTLSASFKQQVTGEMEVVRALYYFNLVNLFGEVPIVTTTNYQVNATLPRVSVDSVYGQIISDLKDAQQKLTANYPSSGHLRPNLYTASALLAKVYLYRGQWQNAYDQAGAVITSGVYSLEPNLNNVFLDGSNEAIWQIPATEPYAGVTADARNFVPNYSPVPNFVLSGFLQDAFEPGDQRFQNWVGLSINNTGVGSDSIFYPYKYKNILNTSPTTEDYMIFRLADTYLIRAEASANLGNGSAALTDLNVVRARAGLSPSTTNPANQAAVLGAIQHERQVELFTEWGNRWFDLKRTGTAAAVLSAEKGGWQPNFALYPVPRTELQADVNLTQNQGY
ncbi:MAG TPA: RagB/SusD family nutrient uptake outer membrane protein [Puia sp.]|nr:RagB/SusD family nutrient uptake outer membrane protein [Puia sp.]